MEDTKEQIKSMTDEAISVTVETAKNLGIKGIYEFIGLNTNDLSFSTGNVQDSKSKVYEVLDKDYHDRLVLSQEDSRSIIWFTKLKVLSIFLFISSIWSCQFNKTDVKEREKVNYFNGIVVDENKNNLPGVKVVCILQKDSSNVRTTITNKDGYFKIWDKKFEKLKIEHGAKLIFSKEGYVSDTVETTQPAPEYKKYPNNYFFIHKEPDTIVIRRKK